MFCSRRTADRRAPDPLGKPNQFKVDFPIKPGESGSTGMVHAFQDAWRLRGHMLSKADLLRVVAPRVSSLKATI